ncbi:MAG: hypothetical protein ACYDHH_31845, partial [Solirubrobacteraceae bacterium]
LGAIDAVNLAAVYAVDDEFVGAIELRTGRQLAARDLDNALAHLPSEVRPKVVHVVRTMPLTAWYRPATARLRKRGLPKAGPSTFLLHEGRYEQPR